MPTEQLLFTFHQFHLRKESLTSLFGCDTPGMQRLCLHPLTHIFKAVFCSGYFRRHVFSSSPSQAKARKKSVRKNTGVVL